MCECWGVQWVGGAGVGGDEPGNLTFGAGCVLVLGGIFWWRAFGTASLHLLLLERISPLLPVGSRVHTVVRLSGSLGWVGSFFFAFFRYSCSLCVLISFASFYFPNQSDCLENDGEG